MKLKFFEYTKNCQEFNVLVKATSENASRSDLKQGQLLFESILQNIIVIDSLIVKIDNTISSNNIEIFGSVEKKLFGPQPISLEYEPDLENIFSVRYDVYDDFIQFEINKILCFLNSDFDYEKHKKDTLDYNNKDHQFYNNTTKIVGWKSKETERFYNDSIEQTISYVLQFYSKISIELKEYINLNLKHKGFK